jgi:hypothetical protein
VHRLGQIASEKVTSLKKMDLEIFAIKEYPLKNDPFPKIFVNEESEFTLK